MKQILLCLLALCLAACVLTSCTHKEGGSEETTTAAPEASAPADTRGETVPDDQPTYVFTVIYGDTLQPVAGMRVQLCKGESFCLMPVVTDENGVARYVLTDGNTYDVYDVHIIGDLPEGYAFDNTAIKTDASTHEYVLPLTHACQHNFVNGICTKCGQAETFEYTVKVVYDSELNDATGHHAAGDPIRGVSLMIINEDGSKIIASGQTSDDGAYTFWAPEYLVRDDNGAVTGGYFIRVTGGMPEGLGADELCSFQGRSKVATVGLYPVATLTGDRSPWDPQYIKAGETISCELPAAKTGDTFSSTDDSYYYYAFRPEKMTDAGLYRLSVNMISGGHTISIGQFIASAAYIWGTPAVSDTGVQPTIEFPIEETYLKDSNGDFSNNNYWLMGVRVEGDNVTYPVTFELTLEKVRDLVPGKDYPAEERHYLTLPADAPGADSVLGSTDGKTLTAVGSNATLVKDSEGFYHVGTVDGPYAVVTITSHNTLILDSEDYVSFANVNLVSGTEQVSLSEIVEKDGMTTIHYYHYYDLLNAYGELCNADGAYMVNDQLLTFLKGYAAQRQGLTDENAYLIGVSYYK